MSSGASIPTQEQGVEPALAVLANPLPGDAPPSEALWGPVDRACLWGWLQKQKDARIGP